LACTTLDKLCVVFNF